METITTTQNAKYSPQMRRLGYIAFSFFCLLASVVANAQPTELSATVDKNPVMLDESFTLSITIDGDVDRNAFDSSPLLADFVVGQTSVSSQTRMVNFQSSKATTWNVTLFPRKVGTFQIPSFNVAGLTSRAFVVDVIPVATSNGQEMREVFVTTELKQNQVYVHQQVQYTVKLYLAREMDRGSLQAPTLEHADIQQIGKDAEYSEIINGKRYRIIERNFVITPQKSGEFVINGPIFQGEIIANTRQSFGFFNRTQSVNRLGPQQALTVLPIPSDITGNFLPSEFVELSEEWSSPLSQWRVGEPITRTVTLTAVGVAESLLPDIEERYPPAIKTYPDQANTASADNGETTVSQRVESTALIPSEAGNFILLPIEVQWFNVNTQTVETATLPAQQITVLPATTGTVNTPSIQQPENAIQTPPATEPQLSQQTALDDQLLAPVQRGVWAFDTRNGWMWSTLTLALLLVGALAILLTKRRPSNNATKPGAARNTETHYWQALQHALQSEQPSLICDALLAWLNTINQARYVTLSQAITRLGDKQLQTLVNDMMSSNFGIETHGWQSKSLVSHLKQLRKATHLTGKKDPILKPLYPS